MVTGDEAGAGLGEELLQPWFTIPLGNRREPDFFPVPGTGRELVPGGFSGKPVSKF